MVHGLARGVRMAGEAVAVDCLHGVPRWRLWGDDGGQDRPRKAVVVVSNEILTETELVAFEARAKIVGMRWAEEETEHGISRFVATIRAQAAELELLRGKTLTMGYTRAQFAAAVDVVHLAMHEVEDQRCTHGETANNVSMILASAHEALHRVGAGLPRVGCGTMDPEIQAAVGSGLGGPVASPPRPLFTVAPMASVAAVRHIGCSIRRIVSERNRRRHHGSGRQAGETRSGRRHNSAEGAEATAAATTSQDGSGNQENPG